MKLGGSGGRLRSSRASQPQAGIPTLKRNDHGLGCGETLLNSILPLSSCVTLSKSLKTPTNLFPFVQWVLKCLAKRTIRHVLGI